MLAWIWCNHKGCQSALSVLKARDKREIVLYSEHFSGQHYYCAIAIFQDLFFFFRFRGSSQPDKRIKWALSCKQKCLHFHPLLVDDMCPSPHFYWTGFHGRLSSEVWLRAFLHSQKSQRLQWLRDSVTMTWMCPFEHRHSMLGSAELPAHVTPIFITMPSGIKGQRTSAYDLFFELLGQ